MWTYENTLHSARVVSAVLQHSKFEFSSANVVLLVLISKCEFAYK